MFIKAKVDGVNVLLNSKYIVDVWGYDNDYVKAYVINNDQDEYKIERSELVEWMQREGEWLYE